jgi:polyphosphate kinase
MDMDGPVIDHAAAEASAPVADPSPLREPTPAPEPVLTDPALYINRELSWLEFNERVLAQVADAAHPLLERVKFLAIVATNLDEFFMIRVASLLRKQRTGAEDVSSDGLSTRDQLARVRAAAADMLQRQADAWNGALRPLLEEQDLHFLDPAAYTPPVVEYLQSYFAREISPVLTPLAFDPGHPFPYISNLSKNLAVVVTHRGRTKFARVKLPDVLPRFVALPPEVAPGSGLSFVFIEDVIRANIQALFPGTHVRGAHLFKVVRDADLVIQEDEADDLLESIDEGLRQRRHGALSMLQVESAMPRRVLDILIENFEIEEENVFRIDTRLGFGDWMQLASLHRPELKYPPLVPSPVWPVDIGEQVFEEIRHQDRLVHHPFESFASVEAFLRAAVHDPHAIAIKMTLYRIGADSPLVDLLVDAAEAGKQVAVLVELKARFDERNNIQWANRLEAAGVHVVYGLVNLKTHCKLCLVVRKESDTIRRYAHIGTGNYNAHTARLYTDLGLFTSRTAIVEDVSDVFNYLTGYSNRTEYRELLVAPVSMREGIASLIEREIAHKAADRPASIIIKINALTDQEMIRALYRASQAGVEIDLLVRGVCCLRPGVPGVSETIRVRSIVGRFLEHSRIFWFENGGHPRVYIGSADLMERNLDRRVEVLCPIQDRRITEHLRTVVLEAYLDDTRRALCLDSDGQYLPPPGAVDADPRNAQDELLAWHAEHARPRE